LTLEGVGGTLNTTTHVFTASAVLAGTAGSALAFDRAAIQRVLVSDNGIGHTGWPVGASFLQTTSSSTMTFTASTIDSATLAALQSSLGVDEAVACGWNFSTSGYTASSSTPVYLSFNIGSGRPLDSIEIWYYNGSAWSQYVPYDLTYDGTYASFTATNFSGYAVVVPEPDMFALLAVTWAGMVAHAWRRRWVC
jgi:hypothetical protein